MPAKVHPTLAIPLFFTVGTLIWYAEFFWVSPPIINDQKAGKTKTETQNVK
jgi:hypothetical protein